MLFTKYIEIVDLDDKLSAASPATVAFVLHDDRVAQLEQPSRLPLRCVCFVEFSVVRCTLRTGSKKPSVSLP